MTLSEEIAEEISKLKELGDTCRSALSKRDFVALGCADVPGDRLRARVFELEGMVCALALAVVDLVGERGQESAVLERGREALLSVTERYFRVQE